MHLHFDEADPRIDEGGGGGEGGLSARRMRGMGRRFRAELMVRSNVKDALFRLKYHFLKRQNAIEM